MKAILGLGITGLLLVAGGDAEAIKKELKALQGKWTIESFEDGQGKKAEFEGATVEFKDRQMAFTKDGETKKGKITLNPAGKPKEMDIKAEGKDEQMLAIYQLEGDKLKMCVSDDPTAGRPRDFAARDRNVLVILKRAKE